MADRGFGKRPAQAIEHRLVGDLARQANISWRKSGGRAAHQELSPMRRRARDVRDTSRVQARDIVGDRLAGFRQHHRTAADDGAQEDLKAAVAPDIIERRPYRWRAAPPTLRG